MTMHAGDVTIQNRAGGEDLRLQADNCRQLAALALSQRNRVFWLRLAEEWAELALTADRQSIS
jgi:DNA phosphorothioation-dependent restriction protein DptG